MTMSCIWVEREKQIVLRIRRLIRVRNVRCLRSICCVLRLPGWCASARPQAEPFQDRNVPDIAQVGPPKVLPRADKFSIGKAVFSNLMLGHEVVEDQRSGQ